MVHKMHFVKLKKNLLETQTVECKNTNRRKAFRPQLTKQNSYNIIISAPSTFDSSGDELTPQINLDDIPESSTNELPLSAITFRSRHSKDPQNQIIPSNPSATNELPLSCPSYINSVQSSSAVLALRTCSDSSLTVFGRAGPLCFPKPFVTTYPPADPIESGQSGRRQGHSIAGQMSYFKVLGFGTRRQAAGSTNSLFSTAVISGSSSAPNLRDMIPNNVNTTTLEGFGGVPPIRPLETLHNALSQRQLDLFLEMAISTPPPATPSQLPTAQPMPQLSAGPSVRNSQTTSTTGSGPPSVISSSGGPPSGLSSEGPSSPNSNCPSTSEQNSSKASVTGGFSSMGIHSVFPNMTVGSENIISTQQDQSSNFSFSGLMQQSMTSGEITPISTGSEWEFNTTDATAGSTAEQDLTCTEEDDEATISSEALSSGLDLTIMSSNNISDKPQLPIDSFYQTSLKSNIIRNDFVSGNSSSYNPAFIQSLPFGSVDFTKYEKHSQDIIDAKNTNNPLDSMKKVHNDPVDSKSNTVKNYFTFETANLFKDVEIPEYKTQLSENAGKIGSFSTFSNDPTLLRTLSTGSSLIKEKEPAMTNKTLRSFHDQLLTDEAKLTRRCSDGSNVDSRKNLSHHTNQQTNDSKMISSSLKALNQSRHDPLSLTESPRKYSNTSSRFTTTVVNEPVGVVSKADESQSKPVVTVANVTNLKTGFNLEENK